MTRAYYAGLVFNVNNGKEICDNIRYPISLFSSSLPCSSGNKTSAIDFADNGCRVPEIKMAFKIDTRSSLSSSSSTAESRTC